MSNDLRGDKYINGSDLLERYDDLQSELDYLQEAIEEAREELTTTIEDGTDHEEERDRVIIAEEKLADWENREEFDSLKEIIDEINRDTTLIREDLFPKYALELAQETGVDLDSWPATCIDWDLAAEELKSDYTCIEFAGESYMVRE